MQDLPTTSDVNILLGVGGGIGAYKAPLLVRELLRLGGTVRTVLTRAAHEFVTPASLQAVSGHQVRSDLFDESAEAAMGHIELARWAEVILIAPATAHLMARLAHGLADDLLTTLVLATGARVVIAPAMNMRMWQHPATMDNVERLKALGYEIMGPDEGEQACGDEGPGRLVAPEILASSVHALLSEPARGPLSGVKAIVTAGPTREAIDPVRYISNHSSGRQGFAMCRAARAAGAEVTLITGPVALATPPGVRRVDVTSAEEMRQAVMSRIADTELLIAVAAVSDFAPVEFAPQKLKKKPEADTWRLELRQNPDVLAEVAGLDEAPFTLGFAAETQNLEENARAKLQSKGIDMIAVNDVADASIGFDSANNAMTIMWRHADQVSSETLAFSSKDEIASRIISRAAECLRHRTRQAP